MLAPHREQTLKGMGREEEMVLSQDSTYVKCSTGKKGDDLGPIGDRRRKATGLILHHALAVSGEGLPLGIGTQKIWARERSQPQTEDQRWAKPSEEKERICWVEALCATHQRVPPPTRKGQSALTFYGIVVTEEQALDKTNEPLEWTLLTNIPPSSLAEALTIIRSSRLRWQIEVFHRSLKPGCHVEGCRVETKDRLVRCSILTWRIFWGPHLARVSPTTPALCVLAPHELHVLRAVTTPTAALTPTLSTAQAVVLVLARLGGLLSRNHDRHPGPTPIWRSGQLLQQLASHVPHQTARRGRLTYG